MSEDSIDFFDGLEEYGHFELALGRLVERMDFVEQMSNNATLHESKLFLAVSSIEGFPHKKGFMKKASVNYTLHVELGLDKHKRKLCTGTALGTLNVKDESPFVFDIVDFYAVAQMKFTLKRKNVVTGVKKVIGEHSVRLMDLLSHQNVHDEKRTKMPLKDYLSSSCYASEHIAMDTTLPSVEVMSEPYPAVAVNWLETAKSSRDEAAKGFKHSILRGYQEAVVVVPRARVKVNFKFRWLPLQKCVQLSTSFLNSGAVSGSSSSLVHSVSDFHSFVAQARASEVIEVMKGLAARQVLAQALRRQSSEGLTPLDFALLAGNTEVVTVILQRAGNLCFRGMVPHRKGPFHYAVEGGSKPCLDLLVRFFTKYSSREPVTRIGGTNTPHWSPLLSELIDWRDEHSDTPLLVACRLTRTHLISSLLLAGADIAAVNRQTGYTPLMCAASVGATEVATMLLSILRSDAELEDNLHAVSIPGASATADTALARHLRSNTRSRNLLRLANPSAGGFFNRLALYNCDPAHTEDGNGQQAIHIAASHGHVELVLRLLGIGVSAAVTDRHGNNLFHLLTKSPNAGSLRSSDVIPLIALEASQSTEYMSLMQHHSSSHYSSSSAAAQVVTQSRPRTLCAANYRGKTPIDTSVEGGHYELTKRLLRGVLAAYPDLAGVVKASVDAAIQLVDELDRLNGAIKVSAAVSASAASPVPPSQQQKTMLSSKVSEASGSTRSATDILLLSATRANSLELGKKMSPTSFLGKASHNSSFTGSASGGNGVPVAANSSSGSGGNAVGGSAHKYSSIAQEDKSDDMAMEEKEDDKADVVTINTAAAVASSSTIASTVGAAVLKASPTNKEKFELSAEHQVQDLLQHLEKVLKQLHSQLQRIYADVAAHTKPERKSVSVQDHKQLEEEECLFDDEADDLDYDFALSALTKKVLAGESSTVS